MEWLLIFDYETITLRTLPFTRFQSRRVINCTTLSSLLAHLLPLTQSIIPSILTKFPKYQSDARSKFIGAETAIIFAKRRLLRLRLVRAQSPVTHIFIFARAATMSSRFYESPRRMICVRACVYARAGGYILALPRALFMEFLISCEMLYRHLDWKGCEIIGKRGNTQRMALDDYFNNYLSAGWEKQYCCQALLCVELFNDEMCDREDDKMALRCRIYDVVGRHEMDRHGNRDSHALFRKTVCATRARRWFSVSVIVILASFEWLASGSSEKHVRTLVARCWGVDHFEKKRFNDGDFLYAISIAEWNQSFSIQCIRAIPP